MRQAIILVSYASPSAVANSSKNKEQLLETRLESHENPPVTNLSFRFRPALVPSLSRKLPRRLGDRALPRDLGRRSRIGRMPVDVAAFEAAMPPPASACSSSSIGKDSDECARPGKEDQEEGEGEGEVQSAYMEAGAGGGGGLAGLEALEEALPIRRSISKFYNGKSKSFACLKEAMTSLGSVKDITKAENAYSRKRKNLLAYSIMYENAQNTGAAQIYEMGRPKRLASLSRSSLVTLASSSSRSSSSISIEENELPEQLQSPWSPDDRENSTSQRSSTPGAGSASPGPMRSLSMMDLHRLHRSSSSVHLQDNKVD